jgi:AcrR family transcriptional regulator
VIVRQGFERTRISDIAREAGTSTGTVHYYFETKDDVLVAALKWANEQPYARMDESLGHGAGDLSRLATLLELSIPYPGPPRDEWVAFLELWGRVLHRSDLLAAGESTEARWRSYFHDIVESGTANGTFRPVGPPDEVADRLVALVDGLGLKAVVGVSWTPERMRELLFRFAAEQLCVPYDELERLGRESAVAVPVDGV